VLDRLSLWPVLTDIKDLPPGEKKKAPEIWSAIREDESLKVENLSESRKEELIQELEALRKTRKTGARVSNPAASLDAITTIDKADDEVSTSYSQAQRKTYQLPCLAFAPAFSHWNAFPAPRRSWPHQ
jgi:hypothetical protein